MNKDHQNLRGRRYIALARCSTFDQADTSLPDQLKLLRSFGDRHGMDYVDYVARDVTGSIPGARTEFVELIQRKKRKNDFDSLLVQDTTRLTRSGVQHAFQVKGDLAAAGITVFYASDHRPTGEYSELVESVEHIAGQLYSKKLGHAVARGLQSSLEQGRIAHCLCVPYGVDRLYAALDGRPLYIIRNLADGTQAKLHPDTYAVLETYPAGHRLHHRLQANARVVLVPGDPDRVRAVRLMFRRRLIDGWAGFRIATELNQLGLMSAKGRLWSVNTIRNLLVNPVYTGIGLANRYTYARFSCRSPAEPRQVETDHEALAKLKKVPGRVRPRSEWIEIEYPLLQDYLGDLRDLAIEWQRGQLKKLAGQVGHKVNRDRHVDSSYILKRLLRSKEGGHLLSGRHGGTKERQHRYYSIHRGFTVPHNNKAMRRLIPACELERTVLRHLREVLLQAPSLRDQIRTTIEHAQRALSDQGSEQDRLQTRRDALVAKIELIVDTLGTVGRDAVKDRPQRMERELAEVSDQLRKVERPHAPATIDPAAFTEVIVAKLTTMGDRLDELPKAALRSLLGIFVPRIEVEMATKNVEIEFALPDWPVLADLTISVSLDAICSRAHGDEANTQERVKIAIFDCQGIDRRHRRLPTCFDCHRRTAA